MNLDLHVHSTYSGHTSIYPLSLFMNKSCNSPGAIHVRAKARGLVTVTDHDRTDGALRIADRPDVIVGCEVTAVFPHEGVRVHLGVIGISEVQHADSAPAPRCP